MTHPQKIKLPNVQSGQPKYDLDKLLSVGSPTVVPPTDASDAVVPPTDASDAVVPPTDASDAVVPPTVVPPTNTSDSVVPPTDASDAVVPPTVVPPTLDRTTYINQWKKKNRDSIKIYLPKGERDFLKAEAAKHGLSLTAMIKAAIKDYLERNTVP